MNFLMALIFLINEGCERLPSLRFLNFFPVSNLLNPNTECSGSHAQFCIVRNYEHCTRLLDHPIYK